MGKRLLLVEGQDDKHVIMHLCKAHGVTIAFDARNPRNETAWEIVEQEGIELLLDQVPVRLKESGLERLAVVVDADEDAERRWKQLRDRLHRADYPSIPLLPDPNGTIVDLPPEVGSIRLGIWIMPDNKLPGMLENFLAFLVPNDDTLLPRVDRFLDSIPPEERRFKNHRSKARIHTFLALQEEPGKRLGSAITARYLDAKREVVTPFLAWLKSVLVD
jgi:hypothetical protein